MLWTRASTISTSFFIAFYRYVWLYLSHNSISIQLNSLQISPTLKRRVNLPSIPSKMRLKAFDQVYLTRAKNQLQDFLDVILRDEILCTCEAVYSFFNEIPPSLLQPTKPHGDEGVFKKTLNFLPSLFKGKRKKNNLPHLKGFLQWPWNDLDL